MLFGEFMLKIVSYFVIWFMNHCNIVVRPTNWWTEEPDISWEVSQPRRASGEPDQGLRQHESSGGGNPPFNPANAGPTFDLWTSAWLSVSHRLWRVWLSSKNQNANRNAWVLKSWITDCRQTVQTGKGWACLLVCVRLSPWAVTAHWTGKRSCVLSHNISKT